MKHSTQLQNSGDLKQPIGVLGIGVEGRDTVNYLIRKGYTDITALDRNPVDQLPDPVKTVFGADHDLGLERFATVFRTPGVRPDHPSLVSAAAAGTVITTAISHFLSQSPCVTAGVTGTVGKGTATSLIAQMLKEDGYPTYLGGNIGSNPLSFLDAITAENRAVLEISSFQAIDVACSPSVVVFLKTTSEHLDWHVDHEEYVNAKAHLVAHQGEEDTVIFNADSRVAVDMALRSRGNAQAYSLTKPVERGIYLQGDRLVFAAGASPAELPIDLERVRLRGRFNLENIAGAILAAVALGCDLEVACRVAENFESLPHRLELAARVGGIRFINDSYATRPEATLGAVSSFAGEAVALILGGSEKYADFDELANVLVNSTNIVSISLIGATARRLGKAINRAGSPPFPLKTYETLETAMEGATLSLGKAGVVLLSPACASFGLFKNYKVRGERFRAKAHELAAKLGENPAQGDGSRR